MSAKIKEMSKRILETRAEYGQVVDDMNALNEKAALENRDFTAVFFFMFYSIVLLYLYFGVYTKFEILSLFSE